VSPDTLSFCIITENRTLGDFNLGENGAGYRIRTRGPLITNQVLYQLS
jgi:hypothetical protein